MSEQTHNAFLCDIGCKHRLPQDRARIQAELTTTVKHQMLVRANANRADALGLKAKYLGLRAHISQHPTGVAETKRTVRFSADDEVYQIEGRLDMKAGTADMDTAPTSALVAEVEDPISPAGSEQAGENTGVWETDGEADEHAEEVQEERPGGVEVIPVVPIPSGVQHAEITPAVATSSPENDPSQSTAEKETKREKGLQILWRKYQLEWANRLVGIEKNDNFGTPERMKVFMEACRLMASKSALEKIKLPKFHEEITLKPIEHVLVSQYVTMLSEADPTEASKLDRYFSDWPIIVNELTMNVDDKPDDFDEQRRSLLRLRPFLNHDLLSRSKTLHKYETPRPMSSETDAEVIKRNGIYAESCFLRARWLGSIQVWNPDTIYLIAKKLIDLNLKNTFRMFKPPLDTDKLLTELYEDLQDVLTHTESSLPEDSSKLYRLLNQARQAMDKLEQSALIPIRDVPSGDKEELYKAYRDLPDAIPIGEEMEVKPEDAKPTTPAPQRTDPAPIPVAVPTPAPKPLVGEKPNDEDETTELRARKMSATIPQRPPSRSSLRSERSRSPSAHGGNRLSGPHDETTPEKLVLPATQRRPLPRKVGNQPESRLVFSRSDTRSGVAKKGREPPNQDRVVEDGAEESNTRGNNRPLPAAASSVFRRRRGQEEDVQNRGGNEPSILRDVYGGLQSLNREVEGIIRRINILEEIIRPHITPSPPGTQQF
jgi:hypothetical protein